MQAYRFDTTGSEEDLKSVEPAPEAAALTSASFSARPAQALSLTSTPFKPSEQK